MIDGIETNSILASFGWVIPLASFSKILYTFNVSFCERLVVIHT